MYIGFWKRVGAYLIDYCILSVVGVIFFIIWGIIGLILQTTLTLVNLDEEVMLNVIATVGTILFFSISWLYSACFESSKLKATIGKLAVGAIVVDRSGERISFWRASLRYWSMIISAIPLFIGLIMVGFTRKKQALHDMIAGTYVMQKVNHTEIINDVRDFKGDPKSI